MSKYKISKRPSLTKRTTSVFLLTGVILVGAVFAPQSASAATELTMMSPELNDNTLQMQQLKSERERKEEQLKEIEPQVEEVKKEQEDVEKAKNELSKATGELEREIAVLKVKVAEKKAREAREAREAATQARVAERARAEAVRAEATRQRTIQRATPTAPRANPTPSYSARNYGGGNTYDYGYCTWYVKNRRGSSLPNMLGNANTWYSRASSMGMAVGSAPRAGAVGTTTRGSLGHVVYVESVNANGTIYISEMNYRGWGQVSYRTTSASEFVYIY